MPRENGIKLFVEYGLVNVGFEEEEDEGPAAAIWVLGEPAGGRTGKGTQRVEAGCTEDEVEEEEQLLVIILVVLVAELEEEVEVEEEINMEGFVDKGLETVNWTTGDVADVVEADEFELLVLKLVGAVTVRVTVLEGVDTVILLLILVLFWVLIAKLVFVGCDWFSAVTVVVVVVVNVFAELVDWEGLFY